MVTLDTLASANIQHALFVTDKVLFAISTALCLLVLALTGWIYCVKEARPHLRRVSFRLMLWALMLSVPYGVFRLFLLSDTPLTREAMAPPVGCSVMSTLFFQTLFTVNCLITCIAINLYLITCLGLNPLQLRLERWYIAGSLFFGLGLPMIPAALGHLGPDPLYGICYLSVGDEDLRLRVLIAELAIWPILSCIVASLAVGATIIRLFRQSRATKRAMRITMQLDDQPIVMEDHRGGSSQGGSEEQKTGFLAIPSLSPIIGSPTPLGADNIPIIETPASPRADRWRVFKRFRSETNNGQLHEKVMRVALRISLYPIALIVINIVQSVTDIYFAYTINDTGGNVGRVILYVFYRTTYAGRGIVLALLCLFCDPCLKRGLAAAWQHTFAPKSHQVDSFLPLSRTPSTDDNSKNQAPMSLADFMNVSVLNKTYAVPETRRPSVQSLDITTALRRLPFHPANLHPFDAIRTERRQNRSGGTPQDDGGAEETAGGRSSSGSFTRSFAGVASASLPSSMTDDVDVDLRLTYSPSRVRYTPHAPLSDEKGDTGDIADELEPLPGQERFGETQEAIVLQPIHATPRPSLASVPDARGIDRRLAKALDKAAQSDDTAAGPSKSRHEGAEVTVQTASKKADTKDEPRKISWGSIPTAPLPARILQRQKKQAAATAAAERRSREVEEEEKRRLEELELQL